MKVAVTDSGFKNLDPERALVEAAGARLELAASHDVADILAVARDADAILVQHAPIDADFISQLERAKVLVRYGIGVDNVDVAAAQKKGIAVCNVPDYGVNEVADHAFSLALSLARQLPALDARLRRGTWSLTPDKPMPALSEMTFATAGFGRIARAALQRARPFGFRCAAYDPFVPEEVMQNEGVASLSLDELFQADIISLHLPLTPETHYFVNAERLGAMKPTAIVVNTARGALIDGAALAQALENGVIAGAGIDVWEEEPPPENHPLFAESLRDRVLLTAHNAWYSESSSARLQRLAGEEIVRSLRGEPLRCPVSA